MARKLVKDREAESDLIGIWIYSCETWNETQADRYLATLEHGIRKLVGDPMSGNLRDGLHKGYWSKRLGHHVAFFTFTEAELRVRRVLHEVMDVGRHL